MIALFLSAHVDGRSVEMSAFTCDCCVRLDASGQSRKVVPFDE